MEQAGAYCDRRSRLERDDGNKNPWPMFLETGKTQGKVFGSRFISKCETRSWLRDFRLGYIVVCGSSDSRLVCPILHTLFSQPTTPTVEII